MIIQIATSDLKLGECIGGVTAVSVQTRPTALYDVGDLVLLRGLGEPLRIKAKDWVAFQAEREEGEPATFCMGG